MPRPEFNLTVGTVQVVSVGSHWVYEGSVSTALVTIDMTGKTINKIIYLVNEDPVNDLFVAFDATTPTAAVVNGSYGTFRLKPGESLQDVTRACSKVRLIRAAGSGNVRFVGV